MKSFIPRQRSREGLPAYTLDLLFRQDTRVTPAHVPLKQIGSLIVRYNQVTETPILTYTGNLADYSDAPPATPSSSTALALFGATTEAFGFMYHNSAHVALTREDEGVRVQASHEAAAGVERFMLDLDEHLRNVHPDALWVGAGVLRTQIS